MRFMEMALATLKESATLVICLKRDQSQQRSNVEFVFSRSCSD